MTSSRPQGCGEERQAGIPVGDGVDQGAVSDRGLLVDTNNAAKTKACARYRDGAAKDGWCCAAKGCHHPFPHSGRTRSTFARFLVHRVARHGRFRFTSVPSSCFYRVTHGGATVDWHFYGWISTDGWTSEDPS